MTHIAGSLAGALLACSCAAQDPRDRSHGFVDAARQTRLTLIEAIQEASASMSGTVDDTFAEAGKVGVWTKADAAASLDDLEITGKQ